MDRQAAARAIDSFLRALRHEPTGELAGTAERVADAWADDLLEGEPIDAATVLREGSMAALDCRRGLIVARDIDVITMCPHHLLPAHGDALVAYMPGDRLAGIGTLAHVVDVLSRRLTLQERIGVQVVDLLATELGARGALCRLSLTHTCLVARGERKARAVIETIATSGTFAEAGIDRDLALSALR